MATDCERTYNERVRDSGLRRGGAARAAVLALMLACGGMRNCAVAQTLAAAPQQIVTVGASPVVTVQLRQGSVTIKTWDRPEIGIDAPDNVVVRHFNPPAVAAALRNGQITFLSRTVPSANGPVTLPVETFSLSSVPPGEHDGVDVRSTDAVPVDVQIEVPSTTALLVTRVARGKVTLQNYRTGTFAVEMRAGRLFMQNMGGNGYAEVVRGPIVAADSSFEQFRARTAVGNIFFERCTTKQIQVSSIGGTIVYDNGSFEPGLARFESQYGNVALGVGSGNVQIGAHSSSGKIFSNFDRRANVTGGATDAQATLGVGGPVVTATSSSGAVYLYDGSFVQHRDRVGGDWRPMNELMQRRTGIEHFAHMRRLPPSATSHPHHL
ncbi:MAG: hypothetical protein ACXWNK_08115 [Vulcanimicrobiaceae bacterium]